MLTYCTSIDRCVKKKGILNPPSVVTEEGTEKIQKIAFKELSELDIGLWPLDNNYNDIMKVEAAAYRFGMHRFSLRRARRAVITIIGMRQVWSQGPL